ncbi:MAG: plastocyanin/azurin family copper-binding protein [Thermoproteota archaeon]|nr:plastocyanin/azurin family copper-binding protein [Thermoproteota archaeon]
MVSIVITISILSSLIAASGIIVLFDNLLIANAQPSQPSASEQLETQKGVDMIIRQGTVTSSQDPLPGHEGMQMATILPFRQDGTVYSGVLTYTSTAPVEVVTLNMQTFNETEQDILNATDDGEFGALFTSQLDDQTSLSSSYIIPSYAGSPIPSASVPFVGNAVWLHTLDGTPFTATFAVNALVLPSQIQNKFNDPLETSDIEALEDDQEGADGEATEDVDNENTTDTDTDGASEQGDDLDAEEETEEDATATTTTSDDEDDDNGLESAAADDTTENVDGADNEEAIVIIPEGSSSLTDDAYRPNPIEVNTGDTVTWINDDLTSHTATSGNPESGSTGMFGGTDDSPEIIGPEGGTQSFTFDEAGEFEYYCTLHPSMVGTVIVTEG